MKKDWYTLRSFLEGPLTRLLLIALSLTLASAVMLAIVETGPNPEISGFADGLWWALIFVLSGFEEIPFTQAGRLVALCLVLFGLTFLGLFTANISAILVEQKLGVKRRFNPMKLDGHIVICGYNSRVKGIISELHAEDIKNHKPVVVLAPDADARMDLGPLAMAVCGDPTKEQDLLGVGIKRASAAIILGEFNGDGDSNSDARAVLTTLAIESLNPAIRTCVEVSDPDNIPHLIYAKADEIVSTGELSANLLSQAALYPGITQVYAELLSNTYGSEIYQLPLPAGFSNRSIKELHSLLLEQDCILVGIRQVGKKSKLNPPLTLLAQEGDELLVISEHQPDIAPK